MSLFLDIHRNIEGLTPEGVAKAHQKDLAVQEKHGVSFLRYWFTENPGAVFCLCEAPSKEAVEAVHREAHGGVPDEVFEVKQGT